MKNSWMKRSVFIVLFTAVACLGAQAEAGEIQSPELVEIVKKLEAQMAAMQRTMAQQNEEIHRLKGEIEFSKSPPSGTEAKTGIQADPEFKEKLTNALGGADQWLKGTKFAGDFRLRYDGIHHGSGSPDALSDRNRFRFRLRLAFEKAFTPDMVVGFGLASGLDNDPTSTNQTMGDMFTWKTISIDKAYVTYTPRWAKIGPIEKLTLSAGKTHNPFEQACTDMIWDTDVRPEGAYEMFDFDLVDMPSFKLKSFLTGGQFILREGAAGGGDANLWAVQGGIRPSFDTPFFDDPVDVLSAVSYYDYNNYADNGNWRLADGTSLARGNTILNVNNSNDLDARDFQVVAVYNELNLPVWKPLSLFNEIAMNPAEATKLGMVRRSNFAWELGAKLNKIRKKGDWEIIYQYKYIGANAVVGAFADADFGDGFAGKCGSVAKLGYALTDNLSLYGNAFIVNNTNAGTEGIVDSHQNRFQIDLIWKF